MPNRRPFNDMMVRAQLTSHLPDPMCTSSTVVKAANMVVKAISTVAKAVAGQLPTAVSPKLLMLDTQA